MTAAEIPTSAIVPEVDPKAKNIYGLLLYTLRAAKKSGATIDRFLLSCDAERILVDDYSNRFGGPPPGPLAIWGVPYGVDVELQGTQLYECRTAPPVMLDMIGNEGQL